MTTRRHRPGPHRTARRADRDRGLTLIELVNVIAVTGMFTAVIAGAIAVVFRTHGGVANTTSSAHDTQQTVSYFFQDVQSGPPDLGDYRATEGTVGSRGSGCDDAGDANVLRFDTGDLRVAYRLTAEGDLAELDRVTCVASPGGWVEWEVVNIADSLDTSAGPAASAEVVPATDDPGRVDHVVLSYVSLVEGASDVTASPRVEPLTTSTPAPVCDDDPLAAAENFQTFIEGDAHLVGTQVKHSLAVGGALSFEGNVSVGQNINNQSQRPETSGLEHAGLLVHRMDWSRTSANASLTVHAGGDAGFEDAGDTAVSPQGQNFVVHQLGDSDRRPGIAVQNGGQVLLGSAWVDFADAFAELRACSDRLAGLPAACGCGAHVGLTDVNGNTYQGTTANSSVKLVLAPGTVNVLNLTEANLADLRDVKWASQFPSSTSPLVINVATGPDATFTPPVVQGAGSTASAIIWNFPNVTGTLTVSGGGGDGVWGTLLAPYAHVTASSKIEGGVFARSFDYTGASINPSRSFDGVVPWD